MRASPKTAFVPRLAMLVDVHDWAFANIADQLVRHLSTDFEFVVIPVEWLGSLHRALMLCQEAELVHVFWREYLSRVDWPEFESECRALAGSTQRFLELTLNRKVMTTSIYDHLFLGAGDVARRAAIFRRLVDGYTVSSARLAAIYRSLPGFPQPAMEAPDGVDLRLFHAAAPDARVRSDPSEMVIGWVGNSRWSSDMHVDHKGLHTVLIPAIELLRSAGCHVRLELVDRADGMRPRAAMPDFYRSLDVYVCCSLHEGTPNPVLEAMACGTTVVSTDVGIVPEAFGPLQRNFILPERSASALAAALLELYRNPSLRARLAGENLGSIRSWDWALRVEPFRRFFLSMLDTVR